VTKNREVNNKNNTSFKIQKKVINNYLFITKNVFLFQELNIKKEFLTEILLGLKKDEKINKPCYSNDIFKNQDSSQINEKHRAVVIEWLSYIVHYFSQSNETLFMSINIMDRYISKKKISLNIYQLVAISSYLIASKYEDTFIPSIDDLIYISKNIYNHNDITTMEKDILNILNFDIFSVSSYQFFSSLYLMSNINNKILFCLGHLILEICLLNIEIMSCEQSLLAIGSFLIAKKSLEIKGGLPNIKLIYNYNENDIKEIQKKIVLFLNKIVYSDKNCLILEKFEKKKYLSVSYIFKCDNKYKLCSKTCYKNNKLCK
jgi:cyclin B